MVLWTAVFLSSLLPPPLYFGHFSDPVLSLRLSPCPANSCALFSARVDSRMWTSEQVLLTVHFAVWFTCQVTGKNCRAACSVDKHLSSVSPQLDRHWRWVMLLLTTNELLETQTALRKEPESTLSPSLYTVRLLFTKPRGEKRQRKSPSLTEEWRVFNIKMFLRSPKLNFRLHI